MSNWRYTPGGTYATGVLEETKPSAAEIETPRQGPKTKIVTRELTNHETGEVSSVSWEEEVETRRRSRDHTYTEVFGFAFPELWAQQDLPQKWQVFFALAASAVPGEVASPFSTGEVARKVGIRDTYCSGLIKELEEMGVVRRKRVRRIALNPHLFWKGKPSERRRAVWEWDKQENQ